MQLSNATLTAIRCSTVRRVAVRPTARRTLSVRAQSAQAVDRATMVDRVHQWFECSGMQEVPIDPLVAQNCVLTDHVNEACYMGAAAIKHRLRAMHDEHPTFRVVETTELVDEIHTSVIAHFEVVPKDEVRREGDVQQGSHVFHFAPDGKIQEIITFVESEEFLDV